MATPPQCMQADDYSAADAARRRLAQKQGLRLFASLTNLRQRTKSATSKKSGTPSHFSESTNELTQQTGDGDTAINLDASAIPDFHENKDVYKWAILYENQRGYISCVSLLGGNDTL